jgi:hypothetical protein
MKKITNLVLIVLVVIALISVVIYLFGGNVNNMMAKVDAMLYVAYVFLGLSVVALIVAAAMNVGKGKGGNTRLNMIVFGGLVVLAVVIWIALAKSTPVVGADGTVFDNVFTLKASDTGLYLTYFALGITVVTLLWGVIRKALK